MVCVGIGSERNPWGNGPGDENYRFSRWMTLNPGHPEGQPRDVLASEIKANFYLQDGVIPKTDNLAIPKSMVWVNISDIPGGSKHEMSAIIERMLISRFGREFIFTESLSQEIIANKVKAAHRSAGEITGPWDWNHLMLSLLAEVSTMSKLANNDFKYSISWRGPIIAFENIIISRHQSDLDSYISSHRGLRHSLFKAETFKEIIDEFRPVLEGGWEKIANWIDADRRNPESKVLCYPWVDLPSPITALSNLSVKRCWTLQEKQGLNRIDKRPWGQHPFSVEQLIQMRFIKAVMASQFPDMFVTFGKYRSDFDAGGAEIIAKELLLKCAQLHLKYQAVPADIQRRDG